MFKIDHLSIATFALVASVCGFGVSQETKLNSAQLLPLPQASNERLGTGVPSRRPKVESQRPVYTIQSGGPVALPAPQFRPIRETGPANAPASKKETSLPTIEQTRPWQKAGSESMTPREHSAKNMLPNRTVPVQTGPSRLRPAMPTTAWSPARTIPEPTVKRHLPQLPASLQPKLGPQPPAALPQPTNISPARVLNFSIN